VSDVVSATVGGRAVSADGAPDEDAAGLRRSARGTRTAGTDGAQPASATRASGRFEYPAAGGVAAEPPRQAPTVTRIR